MKPWRICLLGGLRAERDGVVLTRFPTRKTASLFAYLVYYRHRAHSRDNLIALFWPDTDPASSRNSLSKALSALRQLLRTPGEATSPVIADHASVQLDPTLVFTDVAEFQAALQRAEDEREPEDRRTELTRAVDLYAGELLPDCCEEWVLRERGWLAECFFQALEALLDHLEATGDLNRALELARRGVSLDPLREETQRALIRLYLASGQPALARRQYEELERRLREELDTEPDAATRAVLLLPPPSAPPEAERGRLPTPLTRFFGREEEIEWLREILVGERRRLVTLTGPAGSGKTRLAIEAVRRLVGVWEGIVGFVPLADLDDGRRIADTVRNTLSLPRAPGLEPVEQVIAAVAPRPALLLLDNLEHLLDEAAVLVQTLLERAATVTCLITSRRRLGLSGEREFVVAPLPLPTDDGEAAIADTLLRCPSVQLFVDRAQGVRTDFHLTPGNVTAVTDLCRRLEGIPLALELAAARVSVLSPAQILAQMERRFDLLVSRERDTEERHRSLWAALEWSYRLLPRELQRFFARLCVFRGGWTLAAARTICEEPRALACLEQLRECSLLGVEEDGTETRFRMLETLREFGREQLGTQEWEQVESRHATYYLALAEEAEARLRGCDQVVWLDRLEAEHENCRAILDRCADPSGGREPVDRTIRRCEAETALRLAGALWRFWEIRGYLREGVERLTELLMLPGAQLHSPARAKALNGAGNLAYRLGDLGRAWDFHEESLAIRREVKDRRGIGASLTNLANVALLRGDLHQALALHKEALTVRRSVGNRWDVAQSLDNVGWSTSRLGRFREGQALCREALAILREIGDRQAIGLTLLHLAHAALGAGDCPTARAHCEEGLALLCEVGDRQFTAYACFSLAATTYAQGDTIGARTLYEDGLGQARALGDRHRTATCLHGLGNIARDDGDLDVASRRYDEALTLWRQVGNEHGIAMCYLQTGSLALIRKDLAAAELLFQDSLLLAERTGDRLLQITCLEAIAGLLVAQRRYERGARVLGTAEAWRAKIEAASLTAERAAVERHTAVLRTALGREAFAAAWQAGQAMSLDEAIDLALERPG